MKGSIIYHMKYRITFMLIFAGSPILFAQDYHDKIKRRSDTLASPFAKIEQLSWLAGEWKGTAFGGQVEEYWSSPSNGSMVGTFKLSENGEVSFYEIMVIRQKDQTIELSLKHFDAALNGWEEKDEVVKFPLVASYENIFYFDGLTFEYINPTRINIYVLLDEEDDEMSIEKFSYSKGN